MGSQSNTQSNQTVAPYGVQASSLDTLFPAADRAFRQSRAVGNYNGDYIATPNQTMQDQTQAGVNFTAGDAQNAISGLFGNGYSSMASGLAGTNAAMGGLGNFANTNQSAQTLANAMSFSRPDLVQAQTKAALDSATKNLNENVLPGLSMSGANSGNILSTRGDVAAGIAARDYANQAANVAANFGATDYAQGLNMANSLNQQQLAAYSGLGSLASGLNAQGASNLANGVASNATNQTALNNGIATQLGYQQDFLTNAIDKQSAAKQAPYTSLIPYDALVNGRNIGSVTTGSSTTTTDPGIGSMLGSGLGMIGGLKCDARVKTHIRTVGALWNGLPVYAFEYVDAPGVTHIGPIAQDVEARNADAVFEIDGVMHIKGDFLERI